MHPLEIMPPQLVRHGGAHADKHALRCPGPGVAADSTAADRQARNMTRAARDDGHVMIAHADIFGSDIAPPQPFDDIAKGFEQRVGLGRGGPLHDDALAATHRQPGHGILVAHAARQAQRIGQRGAIIGIGPPAATTGRRPEPR